MKRRFITLDNIRIASPCPIKWTNMQGEARVRFCEHCKLNVYNLSEMTRAEAEQFIQQREGRLCVTFFRRTDGTILTRDCPTGLALRRRRMRWLFASAAAVWGLVAYAFTAFGFDRFSETPLANAWPFKTLVDAVQNRLVATTTPPQIGWRSDGGLFP